MSQKKHNRACGEAWSKAYDNKKSEEAYAEFTQSRSSKQCPRCRQFKHEFAKRRKMRRVS